MSLTQAQALDLYRSDDLIGIGMEADAVRRKLHPEGVATYIIDRNINYTNFCTEYCTFCAFYRPLKGPKAKEGYILEFDTISTLRDAGLDSIPGGGAEILDDEVRHRIARLKCLTDDWLNVHRTAHQLGMRTTATMMFGVGEKHEHRVNHLQAIYNLKEETGGFTAFIPWTFQPQNTALGGRKWDEATAVEYLKNLAISRLFLTNFQNVQSSWVTQGLKVCQLGLRFGGNDVGSVMLEENVVRAAGVTNCTTEEELRRIIRDAGFKPAQRDTLYRTYFMN